MEDFERNSFREENEGVMMASALETSKARTPVFVAEEGRDQNKTNPKVLCFGYVWGFENMKNAIKGTTDTYAKHCDLYTIVMANTSHPEKVPTEFEGFPVANVAMFHRLQLGRFNNDTERFDSAHSIMISASFSLFYLCLEKYSEPWFQEMYVSTTPWLQNYCETLQQAGPFHSYACMDYDTFMIPENMRRLLSTIDRDEPMNLGSPICIWPYCIHPHGYYVGGPITVLTHGAIVLMGEMTSKFFKDPTFRFPDDRWQCDPYNGDKRPNGKMFTGDERWLGPCLYSLGIDNIDAGPPIDEKGGEFFFPRQAAFVYKVCPPSKVIMTEDMKNGRYESKNPCGLYPPMGSFYWHLNRVNKSNSNGVKMGADFMSDYPISFHAYKEPDELRSLYYTVYGINVDKMFVKE